MPINIFFSYAHVDEGLRDDLAKHLSGLRREGLIEEWHDRCVGAGDDWRSAVDQRIEDARVILLLVSADFLDSTTSSAWRWRGPRAGTTPARCASSPSSSGPCDWESTELSKLVVLPRDATPVTRAPIETKPGSPWCARSARWSARCDAPLAASAAPAAAARSSRDEVRDRRLRQATSRRTSLATTPIGFRQRLSGHLAALPVPAPGHSPAPPETPGAARARSVGRDRRRGAVVSWLSGEADLGLRVSTRAGRWRPRAGKPRPWSAQLDLLRLPPRRRGGGRAAAPIHVDVGACYRLADERIPPEDVLARALAHCHLLREGEDAREVWSAIRAEFPGGRHPRRARRGAEPARGGEDHPVLAGLALRRRAPVGPAPPPSRCLLTSRPEVRPHP